MSEKVNILEEAASLVYGDRPAAYGHPKDHFQATADGVTAYLRRRGLLRPGVGLLAEDWPMIMSIEKIVRQAGSICATGELHRDSLVDLAGWPAAAERLSE